MRKSINTIYKILLIKMNSFFIIVTIRNTAQSIFGIHSSEYE
uniref:Uncharacterized protein n=1 Tax=viral metagenome TaxID=1070528 RepID=A0A6C0BBV6_9ZZZZ